MEKVDPPTRRRKCKEQWKVVFRWWGRSLVYSWRRDETVLNSFRAILRSTKPRADYPTLRSVRVYIIQTVVEFRLFIYRFRHGTTPDTERNSTWMEAFSSTVRIS